MSNSRGVVLERIEPVSPSPKVTTVTARFNAYFWQQGPEGLLEFYLIGFRVRDGVIHLPAFVSRGRSHPSGYLSRVWAEELIRAIRGATPIFQQMVPGLTPLREDALLVEHLLPGHRDLMISFPHVSQKRMEKQNVDRILRRDLSR